jgi:P27 family predicted phage terminase small subunit
VRGRKPKPAGMSTRRPRAQSLGTAKLPACPPHVQGEARREWYRLGRKLVTWRLVTEIDAGALALYCTAWARWVEAEASLTRYGTVIKSPNGYPVQSPYLAVANRAMDQMAKLLVEFGMSPSSRSRVTPASPPQHDRPEPVGQDDDGPDPREYLRALG